mmetsp:Transcript_14962/g.28471  ORF Transcript_14962/g.28471 Transcript_14962/m.28471 type:complete len:288 (-) Transcript_14962:349-1212(-)|eukprot:CAMPEP_0201662644 /NCGR_PEP_ID=MMETSP0494-20130426/4687_1 /ASSEMBLY_ACC=CAM_ASM_000839 /TAXON_ID=420259 /ORGANISM="Thalassiosira gravida, Strain GMp14c1" /LENGTH=287 /DNA_ID=CAMNT_0048141073 /DNA_START=62 /DNA_END=925 /DNA_ORIENTATION=-
MPPPNPIPTQRLQTLSDLPSLKLADLQALKLKVARLEAGLERVEKAQQINNNHDELHDHHDETSVISEVSHSSSIKSSGRSVSSSLSMSNIPILFNLKRNKIKKKNKKHRRLPSLSNLGRSRSNSLASRDDVDEDDEDDEDDDDDYDDDDTAQFLKELESELVSTSKSTVHVPALEKKDSMKKNEFNNHIQSSNKKSVKQIGGVVSFKNHTAVTNEIREQTIVEEGPGGPPKPDTLQAWLQWFMGEPDLGCGFCTESMTCGESTYFTDTTCGNSTYRTDATPRLYSI